MKKSIVLIAAFTFASGFAPLGVYAAKPEAPKAKVLAKYDTNKNGKIDPEEYAALRTDFAAKPQGDLARVDTDHDGKLSDQELAALTAAGSKKENRSEADKVEKRARRAAHKPAK